VNGAAGLVGDPDLELYTPGITNRPQGIKLTLQPSEGLSSILKDPDNGGFEVKASTVQVNPQGNTGVGLLSFQAGPDTVTFDNSGAIRANGQLVGNIKDSGLVAPITLPGGAIISTSRQIDGPNGQMAERFTIVNGEYKVTSALRTPSGATPYLDTNFEELNSSAADNATGRDELVPGRTGANGQPLRMGIDDLLRIEPS
jgi:hypothetical protein